MNDDGDPPYKVGKGKPPLHTQFKPGNGGRRKGSKNRSTNLTVQRELERALLGDVPVRKAGGVHKAWGRKLMAERLRSLVLSPKASDVEAGFRILKSFFPYLFKQTQEEVRVIYERAGGSTVPLPTSELYEGK